VRLAQILGTTTIKLTGHTDSTGSKTANVNLARLRAASIKTYLGKFLKKINYKIAVAADNAPVASNKNTAGQAANRRVEITLE
jgi:OOP family OmpA-OmpF porin